MTMQVLVKRGGSRSNRRSRGAIAVELGFVSLILIPSVLGVVEFGRALYAYDTLTKSVRSAARYLGTGVTDQAFQAGLDRHQGARCIVLTGSPAFTGTTCSEPLQLPGLTDAMVTARVPTNSTAVNTVLTGVGTGTMNLVTVSVSGYPLSQFASILFPSLTFGPISATVPHVFF